jgi:hypothetical protein
VANHADELAQPEQSEDDLQNAHKHDCGEEVIDSMLEDKRAHLQQRWNR